MVYFCIVTWFFFSPDAACRTYAIFASDGVGTNTGLTPDDNCIERGGIRVVIDGGEDLFFIFEISLSFYLTLNEHGF